MSFNNSRLRRLEASARNAGCPECKLRPDRPGYVVYHEGEGRPEKADERCPNCGRHLWFVIRVEYEPEEGGGGLLE